MINSCHFIGRAGKDPEVRYLQNGDAVASFSIACSESWKDKDGNKHESTEWINCVAWRKLGEIVGKYVVKGMLIYVSGKMQTRQWDDKDGNKRYTTEIVVRDMKMLSPKGDGGGHDESTPDSQYPYEAPPF